MSDFTREAITITEDTDAVYRIQMDTGRDHLSMITGETVRGIAGHSIWFRFVHDYSRSEVASDPWIIGTIHRIATALEKKKVEWGDLAHPDTYASCDDGVEEFFHSTTGRNYECRMDCKPSVVLGGEP